MDNFKIGGFKFTVLFSFNKPVYIDGIKASKKTNPNYLKSIKGNVYFVFKEDEGNAVRVGTCEYFQSRYANMDPPKSLKDHLKDMWNKPASDFGLIGTLVAKGVNSATSAAVGGALSKSVQDENFTITIEDKFTYSNNLIEGDIDSRENKKSDGDRAISILNEYFENIKSEIGEECILDFDVIKISENKFEVKIMAEGFTLGRISMEI